MANRDFILKAAGLQVLKPATYSLTQGQPLPPGGQEYTVPEVNESTRMNTGGQGAEVLSYLGLPVWADLTLKADEQAEESLNLQTVLLTVDQEKVIVKTPVPGRNGTFKQYVSDGDYQVSIRGAIVGQQPGDYPVEEVKLLLDLMEQNTSMVAVSPFLQLFRVFNLVVESYRLNQVEGFQNVQPFEINCVSDEPIELIENG